MTITVLSRAIVDAVLAMLDRHTFASIPETDIRAACAAVADLLRAGGAAGAEPHDEEAGRPARERQEQEP